MNDRFGSAAVIETNCNRMTAFRGKAAVFRTPCIANTTAFPILRHNGTLDHDGGIITAPGVYAMDLRLMRRRKSSFIHDSGDAARNLADHLEEYRPVARRAPVG